ncbi:MAG: zinc ribbon domain-containing protein [Methanobrevibacter sp.]|nr:zinc ribbon domain-containing protein [Candidatus Methanoflexus mossambicus]
MIFINENNNLNERKFCTNCGERIDNDYIFCIECGERIENYFDLQEKNKTKFSKNTQKKSISTKKVNQAEIGEKINYNKYIIVIICGIIAILILSLFFINVGENSKVISNNNIVNDVNVDFFKSDTSAKDSYNNSSYTSYSWTVNAYSNVGNSLKDYIIRCKFYDVEGQLIDTSDTDFNYYDSDMFNGKIDIGYLYSEGKEYDIDKLIVEVKNKNGKIVQTINQKVETSLQ